MRVLVVDDDAVSRLSVEAMIRRLGYECRTAPDGQAAWDALRNEQIDVLITDREMPHLDGLDLCRRVRAEFTERQIYVIVVTGLSSREQAREGMLAGADDYLVKPTQLIDVELRLIAAERVIELHRHLERANQELRSLARRDAMTGVGNRRRLDEDLSVMTDRLQRYGQRFSVALIDVDHFKIYNDTYGHQQGDEALRSVARALVETSRVGDTWYRYGGEEFLCIYPEQSTAGALRSVERVQARIAELAIPHTGTPGGVLTLSVGIAEMSRQRADTGELVRAADEALYRAKKQGRNRVEVAPRAEGPVVPLPALPSDDVAAAAHGPVLPPPVVPPAVDPAILDELLEQFGGEDAGLRESLIGSYLEQGTGQIAELVTGAATVDPPTVARVAHTLRSSSALLGAMVLAGLLGAVEQAARNGETDLVADAEAIQAEYERVAAEMTDLQVRSEAV